MTLSGTSSVSPVFGAGTHSGPVFSPAVLTGGPNVGPGLAKTDTSSTASGGTVSVATSAVSSVAAPVKAGVSASAASGATQSASPGVPKPAAVSAATASSEASKAASAKAEQASETSKSAVVSEDGQIRQLRAQGQNLSQIAVDLNISVAAVNGDLQTDIPKFETPPPIIESSSSDRSTISVFA